jgi:hypothetical protein
MKSSRPRAGISLNVNSKRKEEEDGGGELGSHLEKEALAARASYLAAVDPAGREAPIRGCVCYYLSFSTPKLISRL